MELTSQYAGIQIGCPVVIGASPMAVDPKRLRELGDHGVGAIVMPSLFEEQIVKDWLGKKFPPGAVPLSDPSPTFGPDLDAYNGGVDGYLRAIEQAKSTARVPIIANLNCVTSGPWMQIADELESAGADAIELNLYHYEVDPHRFAEDVEKDLMRRVSELCDASPLPVAIKLLPQFTCLTNVAYRIAGAGAKSLCLFGQNPDFDFRASGHVGYRWRLTTSQDLRGTLEGIRQVHGRIHNLTLAASGGIHSAEDALVAFELGANAVMLTSAIYRHGIGIVDEIRDALDKEIRSRGLAELSEFVGSQGCGFNPLPEEARRQEYSASLAEIARTMTESED